jgi:hypothetical protein
MEAPFFDHHHAVQFYGSDEKLCETVAGFLAQGFVDRNPAILIATPAHTVAILERLRSRLIDVDTAQRTGDLIVLDAQQTLELFMDGDTPDARRFEDSVGTLITDVLKSRSERTIIRAYGEMVDVLWKSGKPEAAIRLEMLWNKLANQHGFALLCGYAMGNFLKQTTLFEEVCRQHTHVMPAEAILVPDDAKLRVH